MYLLLLDESGTHPGSPVFILGGLAVHEHDAWFFQRRLETLLDRELGPLGLSAADFELHASEIKSPTRPRKPSPWAQVSPGDRLRILGRTYFSIAHYHWVDPAHPAAIFGAVVPRGRPSAEQYAYELVLKKFDTMLSRLFHATGQRDQGLAIHDNRVIERTVQDWTSRWRLAAGRVGRLNNLADVPLFADSRASRLLQAADFITWALWRYYGTVPGDRR
ncbi:MAG: DUF3800 domain-containing protein [Actinobacteria bacterium]|nr:DUF3800 domain-containing protein [Actinomycetota bacterium]